MTIRPFFRWYDLWIGVYFHRESRTLYVCPLPMIGVQIGLNYSYVEELECPKCKGYGLLDFGAFGLGALIWYPKLAGETIQCPFCNGMGTTKQTMRGRPE